MPTSRGCLASHCSSPIFSPGISWRCLFRIQSGNGSGLQGVFGRDTVDPGLVHCPILRGETNRNASGIFRGTIWTALQVDSFGHLRCLQCSHPRNALSHCRESLLQSRSESRCHASLLFLLIAAGAYVMAGGLKMGSTVNFAHALILGVGPAVSASCLPPIGTIASTSRE